MEIKKTWQIEQEHMNEKGEVWDNSDHKRWVAIDEEFIEMLRKLKSFMTNGYGEHKDFRNMGSDYEGRDKVFKYFIELHKSLSTQASKKEVT